MYKKENINACKISGAIFSHTSGVRKKHNAILLTVEIKISSSWGTFCDMQVLPSFMKMCQLAQNLSSWADTPKTSRT